MKTKILNIFILLLFTSINGITQEVGGTGLKPELSQNVPVGGTGLRPEILLSTPIDHSNDIIVPLPELSSKQSEKIEMPDYNPNGLIEDLKKEVEDNKSNLDRQLKPVEYNADEFDPGGRFSKSPCYSELGISLSKDREAEERRYKECEESKIRNESEKYFKIGFGIILVLGFGGTIVYNFNKETKKKK